MRGELRGILVVILFVSFTNYVHSKQHSDIELIEVRTTDKNGVVKARVVARSVGEGPGQDDEDSKPDGSGDSEKPIDIQGDQPITVLNNSSDIENKTAIISPTPSMVNSSLSNEGKTPQINSSSLIVDASKTSKEAVVTSAVEKSTESVVIKPSRTVTSAQSSSSVTVTEKHDETKQQESKTTQPSITTTETPQTTQLNVNTPTGKSVIALINGTHDPVVVTKESDENSTVVSERPKTKVKPTEKSTESSVNVKAHRNPTERPKKTLFGFVTLEILIALLAGALFSILLVAFLVYRLKKRNEGSYELSETIALRPKELDEMGTKKEVFV